MNLVLYGIPPSEKNAFYSVIIYFLTRSSPDPANFDKRSFILILEIGLESSIL